MPAMSMSRRTLALVVAIVLAALAAAALVSYVQGVERRANEGAELVEVFVAKDAIPAGMRGEVAISQGLVVRESVPRRLVADGAISALEEIRGKAAAVPILKGEQILAARFVEPERALAALPIPPNRQAMSVEVGIPPGVAGFIRPGDRISIMANLDVEATGDETQTVTRFLLQNIEVLQVGQLVTVVGSGESETQQTQNRVLLTLAVTPQEAEKLGFAVFNGDLYVTLLPPGQRPANTPGRTAENAFR